MKKLPYSLPISARVTVDTYDNLRTRADVEGKSLNAIVRDAVDHFLKYSPDLRNTAKEGSK